MSKRRRILCLDIVIRPVCIHANQVLHGVLHPEAHVIVIDLKKKKNSCKSPVVHEGRTEIIKRHRRRIEMKGK